MSVISKICTGLFVSALGLTVHGAESKADSPVQEPVEAQTEVNVTNTSEVIQALYVGNTTEIKVADLVREKKQDESLQDFADDLARDHRWMNKILESIANVKSVSLKSEEMSKTAQQIETKKNLDLQALAASPDADFRAAFLEANILEHQKTLELFSRIEQGSSDDAIKITIAIFRQLVEKHLSDAQKLQAADQPAPTN